jgi:hypothetical protein
MSLCGRLTSRSCVARIISIPIRHWRSHSHQTEVEKVGNRPAWWGWKDSNVRTDGYERTSPAARKANFSGLPKVTTRSRRSGPRRSLLPSGPADETGLVLHVHHYPPGTSKWNAIEHRLFCHITQTWRGRPLVDRMAVVELIAATTAKAGLKVESALDTVDLRKGHQGQRCRDENARHLGR